MLRVPVGPACEADVPTPMAALVAITVMALAPTTAAATPALRPSKVRRLKACVGARFMASKARMRNGQLSISRKGGPSKSFTDVNNGHLSESLLSDVLP